MAFESYLHWSFRDEHVLFSSIVLHSTLSFLLASLLVTLICLLERLLTFSLEKQWAPQALKLSSASLALWRTGLYSVVTLLRLCYMLAAMTFHVGLVLIIVASLSVGQLAIEFYNLPKPPQSFSRADRADDISQPLLSQEYVYLSKTRPRSKSKPDDIFIHPTQSNIARADVAAMELGLAGETERVQGHIMAREDSAWEVGKGRDVARDMLLGYTKSPLHESFQIKDPTGSDSESD